MVEVPAHGGSLTEGVVGSPRFVNPLLAITDADRDLTTLTYAGLMGVGPDGLRPVLAERYDVSPDGKVYTFVLKENVKFSDGTPVTAEDVVFTVTKAVDPRLKSPELANWSNVRVEALDTRTVRFTLPKAYAPFLANTTLGILPAHIWSKIADEQFPFTTYMTEPVGAGPFKVYKVTKNSDGMITRFDLTSFGDYALGRPYLSGMRLVFYPSSDDVLNAYEHGAIESGYGIPVPSALRSPYSRVFGIFLNATENKAFGDMAVRKALSIGIDRAHLVNDILGGYAQTRTGPLPVGDGITEPALPSGERVALAKKVLTDNGWAYDQSAGVWKNKKKALTLGPLTISTSNVPELKTLAGEIQKNWEELGIQTSLSYNEPLALSTEVIRPRKYEALFFGMVVGRENDLFAFWDSGERNDPGLNIALYSNRTVDQLLEKARGETDEAARTQELQKASTIIANEYGALFTHTPSFLYAVPNDLKGVILPEITTPADRFATVSTWHRNTAFVWPFFASTSE
jgi:peptide/nickel transport system substrate-binding protein